VAVHAHRSEGVAAALVDHLARSGGRAEVVRADLGDLEQVMRLIPAAATAVGPLTLLVNNAGELERDEAGPFDPDLWERQLAVSLRAPIFLADAFAAQSLRENDASIVNLLDQRMLEPTSRFLSHTLAGTALQMATITLARTLAPRVRVNAVAPSTTPEGPPQNSTIFARQATQIPLGQGPTPDEIAAAVLYLAGARSVTGQTIAVDGGRRMARHPADTAEGDE
jgi:NAD(P)-dependent dehydrogenase (short-subunit alcohol dehydrogenase family)